MDSINTKIDLNVQRRSKSRSDDNEIDRRLGDAAISVRVFMLLCQHNTDVLKQDRDEANLTYYHSTAEPGISLAAYVERLSRHSRCEAEGVLIALRLAGRCHVNHNVSLTRLSAHRLFLSAMTLGNKAHLDKFSTNEVIAQAGSLSLKEVCSLERAFFRDIGYRAVVSHAEILHVQRRARAAWDLQRAGDEKGAIAAAYDAFCGTPALAPIDVPLARSSTSRSPAYLAPYSGSWSASWSHAPRSTTSVDATDAATLSPTALFGALAPSMNGRLPTTEPPSPLDNTSFRNYTVVESIIFPEPI